MVFVYWDNSNIYHEAQRLADEREGTPGARYLVRVHFDNLLRLAHADRPVTRAVAAGSIPPEMQQLWNRMENRGVEVNLFDRGARDQGEQGVPDQWLQLRMLEDGLDHNGAPGIVVLLTGDGAGYAHGRGFHSTLERMHRRGWGVEVLSWAHSCNRGMRIWAETNGVSSHLMTSTTRSPSASRPGPVTNSLRRETKLPSTWHIARGRMEYRMTEPALSPRRSGRRCRTLFSHLLPAGNRPTDRQPGRSSSQWPSVRTRSRRRTSARAGVASACGSHALLTTAGGVGGC